MRVTSSVRARLAAALALAGSVLVVAPVPASAAADVPVRVLVTFRATADRAAPQAAAAVLGADGSRVVRSFIHFPVVVMDATAGQNAIRQAEMFNKAISITGLLVAKLDGTAKAGFVFSIRDQVKVPVKFIGLGETPEDIESFDP